MPSFKALLFDLGGTLLYFDGTWPEVFAKADHQLYAKLEQSGVDLEEHEFIAEFRGRLNAYYVQRESEFIEHTTSYILRTLLAEKGYPDISEDIMQPALAEMYAVSQAYWKTEEDALSTVQTLKAEGYHLGIVSNAGDDADVQTLVDNAQLRPYFDFVLSSAACGIRKPNPRIFQIGLDRWGLAPSETAMVGDTLGADILGAKNAGIFSIWISRRADSPDNRNHLDTIMPDSEIEKLSQIPALLTDLASA